MGRIRILMLLGIMLIVLAMWLFTPQIMELWISMVNKNPQKPIPPNDFGEQFGAISALFSGLALLLAYMTILWQSRQIEQMEADISLHNQNRLELLLKYQQIVYDTERDHLRGDLMAARMLLDLEKAYNDQSERMRKGLNHLFQIELKIKGLWTQQGLAEEDFIMSHEPIGPAEDILWCKIVPNLWTTANLERVKG